MNQRELTIKLKNFRDERNWKPYHTPENLAIGCHLEAAELTALYQWGKSPSKNRVAEEIADNAIYLLYLCDIFNIGLGIMGDCTIDDKGKVPSIKLAVTSHCCAGVVCGAVFGMNGDTAEDAITNIFANYSCLLLLCKNYGFDLEDIILQKIGKNEVKYPVGVDHAAEFGWGLVGV